MERQLLGEITTVIRFYSENKIKSLIFAFSKKNRTEETESKLEVAFPVGVWFEGLIEIPIGLRQSAKTPQNPSKRSIQIYCPFRCGSVSKNRTTKV